MSGFRLRMPRKVFRLIQDICDEYEDRFNAKIATALVVNVLLAEALIHRGLLTRDFLVRQYGCENPIDEGFTSEARRRLKQAEIELEIKRKQELEIKLNAQKRLNELLESWGAWNREIETYHKILNNGNLTIEKREKYEKLIRLRQKNKANAIKEAFSWKDIIPEANKLIELAKKEGLLE